MYAIHTTHDHTACTEFSKHAGVDDHRTAKDYDQGCGEECLNRGEAKRGDGKSDHTEDQLPRTVVIVNDCA